MDEQKNTPEQNKPEKKLSRTTLTFYIVGLFSVAIALILIIKITAIFCLWHAFFSPSHRPEVNPDRMSEAVFPVKDAARP